MSHVKGMTQLIQLTSRKATLLSRVVTGADKVGDLSGVAPNKVSHKYVTRVDNAQLIYAPKLENCCSLPL